MTAVTIHERTQSLTCADKLCCRGTLARRSEAGYPGGDDVVDPCRGCNWWNSRAGPVSGKKISTLSRVGHDDESAQQERGCCSCKVKKSPHPDSSGAGQTGTGLGGSVTTRRLRDNTPRDHDVNFRLEKGRPRRPPSRRIVRSGRDRRGSQRRGRRCPKPMPRIPALCRSAASVRFILFAITVSGVRAFECAWSSRTSRVVQGMRLVSLCAIPDAPVGWGSAAAATARAS